MLELRPAAPTDVKPKESINMAGAKAYEVTPVDKKANGRLDLDKTFKIEYDANCLVGAKPAKNPKKQYWFFTVSSKEERDKWVYLDIDNLIDESFDS